MMANMDQRTSDDDGENKLLMLAIARLRQLFRQYATQRDYGTISVSLVMKAGAPVVVQGSATITEHV